MKSKHCIAIFLLTCILSTAIPNATLFAAANYASVEVIIGFKDAPNPQLIIQNGGIIHEVYSIIPAIYATLPQTAVNQLRSNFEVDYVEADSKLRTATSYTIRWGAEHINATHAWTQSTGEGVKIAVLDTGVGPSNDITVYGGYNFVDENNDYSDKTGHGTMIAGIIAASHDSDLKAAGVAPDAKIYSVKVLDGLNEGSVTDAISGVQWAINNGMQIISMSWTINDQSYALGQALQNAYDNGILLIAAAGNLGDIQSTVGCPASYEQVIAVSAINGENIRLGDSGVGSEIELTAPGESVFSTGPNNTLWVGSGTSYAAAFVTGTAALIWARNPSLTNLQVREILDKTADDMQTGDGKERDIYYGYGLVNASAAVSTTPKNSDVSFSWNPSTIYTGKQVNFDASTSFGGVTGFTTYQWNFGDGKTETTQTAITTHTFTNPGTFSVSLTVSNEFGFSNNKIQTISILQDNIAPVTIDNYDGQLHTATFTVTLTATDDLSGVNQTYYRINDGATKKVSSDGQPIIDVNSLNNKLEYWSIDNTGNEEAHKTTINIKLQTNSQTAQPSTSPSQTQPTPTENGGQQELPIWLILGIIASMITVAVVIFLWRSRK